MRFVLFCLMFYITGCAVAPIVPPTQEEVEAARNYRKTVAVIFSEDTSAQIKGLGPVLERATESILVNLGTVNIVERKVLDKIMKEKALKLSGIAEDKSAIKEMGTVLGADYIIVPEIEAVSLEGPVKTMHKINMTRSKGSSKNVFSSAAIWDEVYADASVSLKIVEVKSAVVTASFGRKARTTLEINKETFRRESEYNKALEYRRNLKKIDAASKLVKGIFGKKVKNEDLSEDYRNLARKAVEKASRMMKYPLAKNFPLEGEVTGIVSEKEVTVNMGSAFGMRPGRRMSVWSLGEPVKDPRTGVVSVPRTQKGKIKITQVTSGLSSIARGRKKTIAVISVGDKVSTLP